MSWTDSSGNLWLFGGSGYDTNGTTGTLNDLWEYDPATNDWTWMGGSDTIGANGGRPGVYGTLGTAAPGNIPGGRSGAVSWIDSSGNFWLFGGSGYDIYGNLTGLNDLWKFEFSSNEWAWMGGSTVSAGCVTYRLGLTICGGQPGVYGTLETPAAEDIPGGRATAVSWIDAGGSFWLFGGQGFDSAGNQGNLNDMWEFDPNAHNWTWMGGNTTEAGCGILPEGNTFCGGRPGIYGTLDAAASTNNPGARFGAASWIDSKGRFWLFGGYGSDSTSNTGVLNDFWGYTEATTALPDFSIAASQNSITLVAGQTGTVGITVTPVNGFSASVSFSCSGLPAGASCSFSPASASPQLTPTSTTLTITTSATTAVTESKLSALLAAGLFAPLLCCVAWSEKCSRQRLMLLTLCAMSLSLLCGCSNYSLSSNASHAVVTVTATSGSLKHATSFTLTIN